MIACLNCFREGSMRTHWLPLIVLLATPFHAAADTVLVPLHHLRVTEVERQLLPDDDRRPVPGPRAAPAERGLIPASVTAWTADERRNAFEVTGTDEGIQAFKQIVQLLDVPIPQVRLSVRILPLTAGGLRGLSAEPMPPGTPGWHPSDSFAVANRDQLASLEAQTALSSSEMTVTSNHPLHLHWGPGPGQPPVPATVLPRVNGDGTVTLLIWRLEPPSALPLGAIVLRHLAGQGAVVLSRTLRTALVVAVREVLPAAAGN
jgi:type II/III secretion system protein